MGDVRFAQGFVGRFVKAPAESTWPLVHRTLGVPATSLEQGVNALNVFGARPHTVALVAESGTVCIKGRPYRADGGTRPTPFGTGDVARELATLDGRFAICMLSTNRLVLATDILGASAVFYHFDPQYGLLFSTHLGLLTRSMSRTPALNQLGVASVLAGSCMLGERTPYEGICRLQAGEYLIAERQGPALTYRIAPYVDVVDELIGGARDERESFESLIMSAVETNAPSPDAGLMLSGGKDSQTLGLALRLLGRHQFRAFSFGEWRSEDLRRAKSFAAALNIEHYAVDYSKWNFESYAETLTELSAGASGLQAAHHLVAYDRLRGQLALGLVGFLGDALTGAHLPRTGQTVLDIVLPFRRNWHPELRAAYATELSLLEAEVEQQWRDRDGLSAIQRSQLTDLVVRQATWISTSFDLCDWFVPLSFPFFSRRLIRFWLNQPIENLKDQRLYANWVSQTFSRLIAETRHTPPFGTRVDEWIQQALDHLHAQTGRVPVVAVVNWPAKLKSSATWLELLAQQTTDERLRRALPAQLRHGSGYYPALLGAGLACAVR